MTVDCAANINEKQRNLLSEYFEIYEFLNVFWSPARWKEKKMSADEMKLEENWIIMTLIKQVFLQRFKHHYEQVVVLPLKN